MVRADGMLAHMCAKGQSHLKMHRVNFLKAECAVEGGGAAK